jgi:hypothetical protein
VTIGQGINIQGSIQHRVLGIQKGFGVRYQQNHWGLGVVYSSTNKVSTESAVNNHEFVGVEAVIPIKTFGPLSFSFVPKAGLVNRYFLIAIPEIEANVRINKIFSLALAAGVRARKPSATLKLNIHTSKI